MLKQLDDCLAKMSREALLELLSANEHACCSGVELWQFALEIDELRSLGLSNSDLRRLVLERCLEHAREKKLDDSDRREFMVSRSLRFTKASCFVLTEEGIEFIRELQDAAQWNGKEPCPRWDCESRELRVGSLLVKRFRCPAQNQETILTAFEEEGWPRRIDDPLPPLSDQDPKRRLHDAIKRLNKNQLQPALKFGGDGTGEGVIWEHHFDLGRVN